MAQILFLSTKQALNSITLVTAGPEQQTLCDPIVYLEAIVVGEIAGHSFQWEQISGTPAVDIITVSETQAYYLVTGLPGSDKVFRFWVDRGTILEQFADITIRTTPQTTALVLQYGAANLLNSMPENIYPNDARIFFGAAYNASVDFSSAAEFAPNPTNVEFPKPEIYFQTSDDDLYFRTTFVGYVFQQQIGSSWVTTSTVGANGPFSINVPLNEKIRVGVMYLSGTGSTNINIYYDTPFIVSSSITSATENLGVIVPGYLFSVDVITKTIIVALELSYDDNSSIISYSSNVYDTTTRNVYVVEEQSYDELGMVALYGMNLGHSITRTSGGGSIGG